MDKLHNIKTNLNDYDILSIVDNIKTILVSDEMKQKISKIYKKDKDVMNILNYTIYLLNNHPTSTSKIIISNYKQNIDSILCKWEKYV